jgi:hypothetical protein
VKLEFPWIALGIGLLIVLVLLQAGATGSGNGYGLPLLTLLILSEFGGIVAAIGAFLGIRGLRRRGLSWPLLLATLGCLSIVVALLVLGIRLWPGG